MSISKYPPYERFIPWRCDADYEMAIVSPVGIGPKGDIGDPMTWEDMTEKDKLELIRLAIDEGLQGPPGPEGPEGPEGPQGQPLTYEDWSSEDKIEFFQEALDAGFAKGDTGDTGPKGDFESLTEAEQEQVAEYVGAMAVRGSLDDISATYTTGDTTSADNPVTRIVIPASLSYRSSDILRVSVNGLDIFNPRDYTIDTANSPAAIVFESGKEITHPNVDVEFYILRARWTGSGGGGGGGSFDVDDVYPVGSIYMNVSSDNPGNLFGGTWERIQDMFLLASGSTFENGSTGGEAEHLLTGAESGLKSHGHEHTIVATTKALSHSAHNVTFTRPTVSGGGGASISGGSHTHQLRRQTTNKQFAKGTYGWDEGYVASGAGTITNGSATTSATHTHSLPNHTHTVSGGGVSVAAHSNHPATDCDMRGGVSDAAAANAAQAHNNMPPYLAVYIWKRVA